MTNTLPETKDERGVATLSLNRPDRHNPFDDALIAEIAATFKRLGKNDCVFASEERSFLAGANLAENLVFLCEDRAVNALLGEETGRRHCRAPCISRESGGYPAFLEERSPAWQRQY